MTHSLDYEFASLYDSLADNTTTSTNQTVYGGSFGLYGILVASFSAGPFILVFLTLFVISLISFFIQIKQLKKNQSLLFFLLFALEITAVFSNTFRSGAELANLHPDYATRVPLNNGLKVIDRFLVSWLIFIQALILSFICYVL